MLYDKTQRRNAAQWPNFEADTEIRLAEIEASFLYQSVTGIHGLVKILRRSAIERIERDIDHASSGALGSRDDFYRELEIWCALLALAERAALAVDDMRASPAISEKSV